MDRARAITSVKEPAVDTRAASAGRLVSKRRRSRGEYTRCERPGSPSARAPIFWPRSASEATWCPRLVQRRLRRSSARSLGAAVLSRRRRRGLGTASCSSGDRLLTHIALRRSSDVWMRARCFERGGLADRKDFAFDESIQFRLSRADRYQLLCLRALLDRMQRSKNSFKFSDGGFIISGLDGAPAGYLNVLPLWQLGGFFFFFFREGVIYFSSAVFRNIFQAHPNGVRLDRTILAIYMAQARLLSITEKFPRLAILMARCCSTLCVCVFFFSTYQDSR